MMEKIYLDIDFEINLLEIRRTYVKSRIEKLNTKPPYRGICYEIITRVIEEDDLYTVEQWQEELIRIEKKLNILNEYMI